MKKNIFILIILFLSIANNVPLSAGNRYSKDLALLSIENDSLKMVLNKAIDYLTPFQKKPENLIFKIVTLKKGKDMYFDLTYAYEKEIVLDDIWKPYGYLDFQNHPFFVFGDEIGLFVKTEKTKLFVINDEPKFLFVHEPTEWLYQIIQEKFILLKVINECVDINHQVVKFK